MPKVISNSPYFNGIFGKKEPLLKGGFDAIVNEIDRLRPDFITLSEVRNYRNTDFTARFGERIAQERRYLLLVLFR